MRKINQKAVKRIFFRLIAAAILFLGFLFSTPRHLFHDPYSTVVESSDGHLLGARIAADQQWRFPELDSVPAKYKKCLLLFEDRYFYLHPGINPVALMRAFYQNIRAGKIVSGGSTITMQVCRMARMQKPRTVKNKLIEMLWALNVELRYSKQEILKMYASHAPFGGNVVGLDAASRRYFQHPPAELSWAEAAVLAVLPNAPSLIYPGRLDVRLRKKRDRLLEQLLQNGHIDSLTFRLSVAEPLPGKANPMPEMAYHLVEKAVREKPGQRVHSSVDYFLQEKVNDLVLEHHKHLKSNGIHNIAVIVAEVSARQVKAYVGNVFDGVEDQHGNHVDAAQAPRSTGSILKPFLYCKMTDDGMLTPDMLIPDVPVRFGGFTPVNFDQEYNGAVPAGEALARSLNIPAVYMLRNCGVAPFYSFLKQTGMNTLAHPPDHYGLSLILGGAEVTLWDLTGMYTSLVSILEKYDENDGFYDARPFRELTWEYALQEKPSEKGTATQPAVRAASVYLTLQALLDVKRPESEAGWQSFATARKIAWKTGTSFGFRDGWAVGMTHDYVVAVWTGNADGEGRQGLTGVTSAAPLLFDIFTVLPRSAWFNMPIDEMEEIEICAESGFRPGVNCEESITIFLPRGSAVGVCPWHQKIHLEREGMFRVNADCYPVSKMVHTNWFVLPPAMEYYYKPRNPDYALLPPMAPGCEEDQENMEFIYPGEWNNLFLPTDLDGTPGSMIFDLVHRHRNAVVYWHLDKTFIGTTRNIHQMALKPETGWHVLNVTDEQGNQLSRSFFIAGSENTVN